MAGNLFSEQGSRLIGGVIAGLARAFPGAAVRALSRYLDGLPAPVVLSRVLKDTGIEAIRVSGAQGVFEGSAADASVIQRYALDREWSSRMIDEVVAFFRENGQGTYFDIGGNIGLTAIPIAASGAKVLAFEPVPENFAFLSRNAVLNGVADRIGLNNVALMDEPGELVFELSPSNHGDHRARRGEALSLMSEDQWDTVKVAGRKLDDFAGEIAGPLVLKIDTQGAEPLVIAGGRAVCDRARLVFIEFSPYNMHRMQTDVGVMIDFAAGFDRIRCFEGEAEEDSRYVPREEIAARLGRYFDQYKTVTSGRYLNLILSR